MKAFAFTETPLLQFPCPIYRAGASWAMNSATASFIRKLKDAENRYLWQPALSRTPRSAAWLSGQRFALARNFVSRLPARRARIKEHGDGH